MLFELHYDPKCVAESPSEDCFSVTTLWNGNKLDFMECSSLSEHNSCTYEHFKEHMKNLWYDGLYAPDLDKACFQPDIAKETNIYFD